MLNLIGGADVRGLPGSDVASSILLPSEMQKLLLLLRAKYVVERSFIFQTKVGGQSKRRWKGRWEVEDCVVGVGASAIHWLPCDGVTMQSVE